LETQQIVVARVLENLLRVLKVVTVCAKLLGNKRYEEGPASGRDAGR